MTTGDCRADFIKDYNFPRAFQFNQVDPDCNLEIAKGSSSLHVNSLTPYLLSMIVENCQLIKSLQFNSIVGNLSDVWSLNDNNQDKPLSRLIGLRMLICPSNIDEGNLSLLLANCPNLETLIICFAQDGQANYGISGKCFQYLGENIKHLIFGNLVFKRETINRLLESNGRLIQEIEILFPLIESTFDRVLEFVNLRKLTFKACYCSYEQMINLSKLINLESLQIERLDFVNDTLEELFSSVFQKCKRLKQFKVSGTFKLYSCRLLELIVENNLKLTHLHILPNIYKHSMKPLQINISDSINSLASLKTLQSLSLRHTNLNDDNLKTLLTNCPHLETIDLSYGQSITSADYIVTHANKNPNQNYFVYLQSTRIQCLPNLPNNLKLCICDCERNERLPLIPPSFYDLI